LISSVSFNTYQNRNLQNSKDILNLGKNSYCLAILAQKSHHELFPRLFSSYILVRKLQDDEYLKRANYVDSKY
jgi:hypothetical protein